MWKLDYKESWALKNWSFWTVALEKTLENPLDCKEIQPVHPKGDQSRVFIGRTDVVAQTLILWPPDWRADSFEKTLMLGKIEGRRRGRQRMRWLDGTIDSGDILLFSHSVVSNSWRPHESQHARPPCPSPTPGVHSRPSSRWCHPAISSSVVSFSSCPQSLPAFRSFPISQLFAWGGQSIGVSAFSIIPPNEHPGLISFRMDWLDLLAVQGTLKSLL